MNPVEQFLYDHWMSVDDLINSVVDLVPDREFYGDRLDNAVFRQMRHDLDSLIFRRNNNPNNKELQRLYQEKLDHYNKAVKESALSCKENYKKKLLVYSHDKKVKILIDLIRRHRLLKYLDREG